MVFTVVTIVFVSYTNNDFSNSRLKRQIQLPMSFLATIFTLNVSSFPHDSNGISYEPEWIFPILCESQAIRTSYNLLNIYVVGTSVAISIPIIFLALYLDVIPSFFKRMWKKSEIKAPNVALNVQSAMAVLENRSTGGKNMVSRKKYKEESFVQLPLGPIGWYGLTSKASISGLFVGRLWNGTTSGTNLSTRLSECNISFLLLEQSYKCST